MPEATAGRLLVITTWACFPADGGSPTCWYNLSALCQPLPCEDLLYIRLQGRAPRARPGLAVVHAKAPRDGDADC
jgi:hypothetical protein